MDCIWLSFITVCGIRGQREGQVFLGIKYFNPIQFKPSYRVGMPNMKVLNYTLHLTSNFQSTLTKVEIQSVLV